MIVRKNSLSPPHNDNYETNNKYIKFQHHKMLKLTLPEVLLLF